MLYERSSITASLAKHLKFQKLVTFVDAPWVNSYTSKQKKLKSGEYTFWKRDIQGAPRKNQYHCYIRGAHKISRINVFCTYTFGK